MKKVWIIIGSIIGILILGIGGYAYYVYHYAKQTAEEMHESDEKPPPEANLPSKQKPISILLMGVDQRKGDPGRSDTLIVITLNPKKKKMMMVSIPRDTRTEIIGKGTTDKINHAYAFGGTKMSVDTVENFVGIPINYYIRVNMKALEELVDAVGGITVHNDIDWFDEGYYRKGYHYRKGDITLNGPQALGFVRMRHLDPKGDFGRNERQRKVITAIIHKAVDISSVTRITDILYALGKNVKTNMTFDEMMNIQKNYRDSQKNITQYEVKGNGEKLNGIYYLVVPQEEKQRITNDLKESLKE
ncbi:LCP family protein [Bacillus sp. FJAT-49736]|uniref:LCP family glycopolymer transferase n=1 Tax=Bacillus sp. FJAT-49736 TaxID=2833582 RepID=UPI001BC9EDA3|nr:LCP family protein [Bacillus sp. FJAT-49736]MBS4174559.1 LCP family protein [Bacillus sp. FJAT-49736]